MMLYCALNERSVSDICLNAVCILRPADALPEYYVLRVLSTKRA
jgi:hypothetical protein